MARNIEVFEIKSKKDKIYQELLKQYETNPEVQMLLNEPIIPSGLIYAGDFSLINTLKKVINTDGIKLYLVIDFDNNIFLWIIGKFDTGKLAMYPLLKKQSKNYSWRYEKHLLKKV